MKCQTLFSVKNAFKIFSDTVFKKTKSFNIFPFLLFQSLINLFDIFRICW